MRNEGVKGNFMIEKMKCLQKANIRGYQLVKRKKVGNSTNWLDLFEEVCTFPTVIRDQQYRIIATAARQAVKDLHFHL